MIELEKTYLLKYLPKDLDKKKFKETLDIYIPKSSVHPTLRIRKSGDKLEITKKHPVKLNDISKQLEQTITLSEEEYKTLSKVIGKKVHKKRYLYDYNNLIGEVDVFQDELKGLVLVDFEFKNVKEKNRFKKPDFCLAEVTQELFIAGGMLCGKKYKDIEKELKRYAYKKITAK